MERRKFTREFKLEAVRLIKDRGVSYVQASQHSPATLLPCPNMTILSGAEGPRRQSLWGERRHRTTQASTNLGETMPAADRCGVQLIAP
jgi:hypothetical protein